MGNFSIMLPGTGWHISQVNQNRYKVFRIIKRATKIIPETEYEDYSQEFNIDAHSEIISCNCVVDFELKRFSDGGEYHYLGSRGRLKENGDYKFSISKGWLRNGIYLDSHDLLQTFKSEIMCISIFESIQYNLQ
jgi:hypothetical protein